PMDGSFTSSCSPQSFGLRSYFPFQAVSVSLERTFTSLTSRAFRRTSHHRKVVDCSNPTSR
ncbi:MAG: hypothetical protein LAO31_19405, partial [Acidobacteriia bacterium]|nr:hypothetical protein [Terriglobia bacterium]